MKNLKLISLIGVCFMFILSCQNEEPSTHNVILNYEGFGEIIIDGSITPVSVTVNVGDPDYVSTVISENKDSIEKAMEKCVQYGWYSDNVASVRMTHGDDTFYTFYNLKPNTVYYYFVIEEGISSTDACKISPILSFKTEDLTLHVNMGGSIEWCGVNYLENRGEFNSAQFISSSLFRYNELPDPGSEVIEGNWRYPTIQELEELLETGTVTMVDLTEKFVCLTSPDGNNLYIPFTYQKPWDDWNGGYRHLMLIPADDHESGLYVSTTYLRQYTYGVKCGYELEGYKLKIEKRPSYIINLSDCSDFFHWSYTDSTGGSSQKKSGDDKRGMRFVCEK